jgi:alpha-glucosidase
MRFWLDRGVAGFRLDAIDTLLEDPTLADEAYANLDAKGTSEINETLATRKWTASRPKPARDHDIIRNCAMVASYPGDRVLIGETYLPNIQELDKWYGGAAHDELQLPMDTQIGMVKENGSTRTVAQAAERGRDQAPRQPAAAGD